MYMLWIRINRCIDALMVAVAEVDDHRRIDKGSNGNNLE